MRVVLFGNAGGEAPEALPSFRRLLGGNLGLIGFSITTLRKTHSSRVADALITGLTMLEPGQVRPPVTIVESLDTSAPSMTCSLTAGTGKYVVRAAETPNAAGE